MKRIDNYCIEVKLRFSGNWVFFTGYKTLPTLKKKIIVLRQKGTPMGSEFRIVARNYDREIIKIYDF